MSSNRVRTKGLQDIEDECLLGITREEAASCTKHLQKAALILVRDGRLLVARNHDQALFFLPGGVVENGETADQALCRELQEECSVQLISEQFVYYNTFLFPAAGKSGTCVCMICFCLQEEVCWPESASASNEVAELKWVCGQDLELVPVGLRLLIKILMSEGLVSEQHPPEICTERGVSLKSDVRLFPPDSTTCHVTNIEIKPLGSCPSEAMPLLAAWHHAEFGGRTAEERLAEMQGIFIAGAAAPHMPYYLVALHDGYPAGSVRFVADDFGGLRPEYSPWLATLYVSPEHRGKGLGSRLVRACEELAVEGGHHSLYLWAANDRVEGLYSHLGWICVERASAPPGAKVGKNVPIMKAPLSRLLST